MSVEYFRSNKVTWKQGVHLQRVRWHSCMQWGWPAIRSGERLERWCDYWVLSISWRRFGVCWHWSPKWIRNRNPANRQSGGLR